MEVHASRWETLDQVKEVFHLKFELVLWVDMVKDFHFV
jgi:hypothetical protein